MTEFISDADKADDEAQKYWERMTAAEIERNNLRREVADLKADRDRARDIAVALEQADERVRELHAKFTCGCGDDHGIGCKECRNSDYPCPTTLALDGGEAL